MYDEEVVLTVSDWYHDQMHGLLSWFMSKANPTGAEPVPNSALLNDTQNLTVPLQPGRTYLFRMVNIGAFAGQYVWFEGHNMTILEVDGVYTHPAGASMIYLSAAQRCSFLITARNDTPQNFPIVASMDTVSSACRCSLAQLTSAGLVRHAARQPQLERDGMACLRLGEATPGPSRGLRP
jgi:iron transport multicopper oxidase